MSDFGPPGNTAFKPPPESFDAGCANAERGCSKLFQPASNLLPRGVCSNPLIPPGVGRDPDPLPLGRSGVRGPTQPLELASLASAVGASTWRRP